MFGRTFFHDTMRKYVILFGTLFNDVWINREDSQGNVKDSIKVPLSYGPREKFLARITGIDQGYDPLQQPFSVVLPRMGFEITGFTYSGDRKLPARNKFVVEDVTSNNDKRQYQYNPVPYDMTFSLSIFVKNAVDGTRIVEQILPYFKPEWVSTVQLVETPDVTLDIPLIINNVQLDEVYEGSFEDNRTIVWQLDFTMRGYFFGPVYKQEIIKLANTQVFDSTLFTDIDDSINQVNVATRITNQPGLLAGDQPTVYTSLNAIQATAVATIQDGAVTAIDLTNTGLGYSAATVSITGGNGANAEAAAVVSSNIDQVTQIIVTDGGSGYTSTPTVTISTPDLISLESAQIDSDSNYGIATTIDSPFPD